MVFVLWQNSCLEGFMSDKGTVRIEDFEGLRVAYLRDQGHSHDISPRLMSKLRALVDQAGSHGPHALRRPDALFLAIINDSPHATDHGHVRVDAAVSVPADFQLPAGSELALRDLPPGTYAVYHHVGSLKGVGDAWAHMASLTPIQSIRLRGPSILGPRYPNDPGPEKTPSFEIFRNDPTQTPEADLITELYQPVVNFP